MRLHGIFLYCIVLTGFTDLPRAMAQSQPNSGSLYQTVRLANGAIYQGELVEFVPNDHVTIRLVGGEIRRFAWGELQVTGTPNASPVPGVSVTVAPPVVVVPDAGPPPQPADLVQLHFEATDPGAVLFSSNITGGVHFNSPGLNFDPLLQDWNMVCPRPLCDLRADRRRIYSVQGPGIVSSLPFTLPPGNLVTVDARVAHQGVRTFWKVGAILGAAAAAAGLAVLIYGAAQDTSTEFDIDPNSAASKQNQQNALNQQKTAYIAGGVLLGGGALLTITGIIAAAYTRTSVRFRSDGQLALQLPGKAQLELAPMQVRF